MQPVIRSLLETDLYKFTMWQAMLHRHPQTQAEYVFICRNARDYPLTHLIGELNEQLDHLCSLRFQPDELAYLRGLRFIKTDFVDFLRIFQFQRDFITVRDNAGTLEIVARGPQVHVMAFEIHVLAIVNELYFRRVDQAAAIAEGRQRLADKVQLLRDFAREPRRRNPFEFFDFGVRRRFSGDWHREVVATLQREVPEYFMAPATCCWRVTWAWCPSAPWRMSSCRPTRPWACGCATSRRRRSKPGCRNTAATWAWR